MDNCIYCGLSKSVNTIFTNTAEEISQKISEILPFSKIAMLSFSNEFFEFGKQVKDYLFQNGQRVIEIIIDDNFSAEKEKFDDFLSIPEDVRGIIAFNKRLIPLVCSSYLEDKKAFFIERANSICGLFENYYYIKDCDLMKKQSKNQQLYIMINTAEFNLTNHIKSACLYVNMLIDYLFRQGLLQEEIDMDFVNKIKSNLIDFLFFIKDVKGKCHKNIIEKLIYIDQAMSNKDCYYSCSAIISSFLMAGHFFNLDYAFSASKIIIKEYEHMLFNQQEKEAVDYNQTAKALAFVIGLNQKHILASLDSMVKKINTKGLFNIKEEIDKLILLYKNLKKNIKGNKEIKDKFYLHNMLLSIDLCGATPFGVNGMSVF